MKSILVKFFLPIITLGMVISTSGLKEAAVGLFADEPTRVYANRYTSPYCDNKSDSEVKAAIKLTSPTSARYPAFTFLIPGLGSNRSAWSNGLEYNPTASNSKYYITGTSSFSYNSDSIVAKIENSTGNEAKVYYVTCDSNDTTKYHIYYCERQTDYYSIDSEFKSIIENPFADKHSIIVYNSNNSGQSFSEEYKNFERIANRLCYDFKAKYNFVPRVNLIGHSRGGLVAQEYANNYPFNVYSINTLATPFFGSETGSMVQRLSTYLLIGAVVRELGKGFLESPGFLDLQDKTASNERRNAWNQARMSSDTRATSYGSVLTLPFISRLLRLTVDSLPSNDFGERCLKNLLDLFVSILISAFDDINDHYTNNGGTPDFTALMKEDIFNKDCVSTDSFAKDRLKNALRGIRTIIFGLAGELLEFIRPILRLIPGSSLILWILYLVVFVETEFAFDDFAKTLANNIVSYKGQVCVLKDDFLVSLDSQLSPGYSNYTRFVKVFDDKYLNNSFGVTERNVLVGHNLETLNKQITDSVVKRGKFTSKEDILDDIRDRATYRTVKRNAQANYVLNQDDLVIINGHGQLWGEYRAVVSVPDVEAKYYDTVEIVCYDNHSNAEFFYDVINFWGGAIELILYVREDSFDASGYITINYSYESDLRLDHISITPPTKTNYFTNENLNLSGLIVTAYYSNGVSEAVTEYGVELSDPNLMGTTGSHTITINYAEPVAEGDITIPNVKSQSFDIFVRDPELIDFKVGSSECKTDFEIGSEFNCDNLQAVAYYEDGKCEHVSDYVVDTSNVNMDQLGTYDVAVSYTVRGITKTDWYQINVINAPLVSLTLSGNYQKIYQQGDEFSCSGLKVTANYENGRSSLITDYAIDASEVNMDRAGTYKVYVSYSENNVTLETSYSIVVKPNLLSITISGNYQTVFSLGETFNYDGLQVTAHYSDGSSKMVYNFLVISDMNYNMPGYYTAIVAYSERGTQVETTYRVTVKDSTGAQKTLSSISLSGSYKRVFNVGDVFTYSGLIVTAHYSDGTTAVVKNYVVDDSRVIPLQAGIYTVKVSYTEGGITKTESYKVLYDISYHFNPKDPIFNPKDPIIIIRP